MKIRFVVMTIIIFTQLLFAQTGKSKYQIDFNEIKGELTSKDLFKKDFGRYDGFEIDLFEGEAVNIIAYSGNFQPSLALVNQSGDIVKQSSRNDKGYANIVSVITAGGKFVLYVIGEEKARGKYTLQTAIAEPDALTPENGATLCQTLDFLIAHAKAYFFLLENPEVSRGPLVKLNEAQDAYIDEEEGSYNAIFYSGNQESESEVIFNNIYEKTKECLGKEWLISNENWKMREDYREKSTTFTEKTVGSPRFVKIVLNDYTNSKEKSEVNYTVEVQINRKH